MSLRKITLRDQNFIKRFEEFIAESEGYQRKKLSPKELYAFYYEFNLTPVITKKTKLVRVSMQELIANFASSPRILLEDKGLFNKVKDNKENSECRFTNLNTEFLNFNNFLKILNKRITFFFGNFKAESKIFEITEIRVYIPSVKDTTLYLKGWVDIFEKEINLFLKEGSHIENIYQYGVIISGTPNFCGEFFIFTKMKILGQASIVINYTP